jgi:hypothetical protein
VKTTFVRVQLSEQQKAYLDIAAKTFRASPGDLLVAFAFGLIEINQDTGGDKPVESWLQLLRDFVDDRKVPTPDPQEIDGTTYQPMGRLAVEVPHA